VFVVTGCSCARAGSPVGGNTAPALTNVNVDRPRYSAVTGYNEIRLTFDTSKAVDTVPASLKVTLGEALFKCGARQTTSPNYTCTYAVTGTETEGDQTVSLQATDAAGRVGTASATVTLDFTPPSWAQATATPASARRGVVETLELTPSEPLLRAPTLLARTESGTVPFALTEGSGYTFTHTIAEADADGWCFTVLTLIDSVGNQATIEGPSFTIDTTVPTLSNIATDANLYSAIAGFNVVTVTFDASESLDAMAAALDVSLEGTTMTCVDVSPATPRYSCTYKTKGTEGDGPHVIAIQATDAAGNSSNATAVVNFDFTPPSLTSGVTLTYLPGATSLLSSVTAATVGTTMRVTFSTDEALTPASSVSIASGGVIFAEASPGGVNHVFSAELSAA
jgi:hypothetical protein